MYGRSPITDGIQTLWVGSFITRAYPIFRTLSRFKRTATLCLSPQQPRIERGESVPQLVIAEARRDFLTPKLAETLA